MLHHLPPSILTDPFHFSSSSPDRLTTDSYVATRNTPYSLKSPNTHYYTSLRSTAQSVAIQQHTGVASDKVSSKASSLLQLSSIDCLYTSAEAAARSPRCSSKPKTSQDRHLPLPTMVTAKPHTVKALALNAMQTAAKRSNCIKPASAAVGKRYRSIVEGAKRHSKTANGALASSASPRARQRSQSPPLLSSPSARSTQVHRFEASKVTWQIPKIVVRSPTPEPEGPVEQMLDVANSQTSETDRDEPLYVKSLLRGLDADLQNVAHGVDSILSKYFDLRKRALPISVELLRYLVSSICKLYLFIEDPDSELGVAKARAICSHVFQHLVTGFFHLLDDPHAPYGTASSLALVSAKIVQDFDKAAGRCCLALDVPSAVPNSFSHSKLFLKVLKDELNKILDRGTALADQQNRLALPGKGSPIFQSFGSDDGSEDDPYIYRPAANTRREREELRKAWAREGHENDRFVGIDVVRLTGELALYRILDVSCVAQWLERFFVKTVFPDIPSVWEVECGCALLITVGAMLDSKAPISGPPTGPGDRTSKAPSLDEDSKNRKDACAALLNKVMNRVSFLVTEADISESAREWLKEVEILRGHGWQRDNESDSTL